jgi:hypothetical protein
VNSDPSSRARGAGESLDEDAGDGAGTRKATIVQSCALTLLAEKQRSCRPTNMRSDVRERLCYRNRHSEHLNPRPPARNDQVVEVHRFSRYCRPWLLPTSVSEHVWFRRRFSAGQEMGGHPCLRERRKTVLDLKTAWVFRGLLRQPGPTTGEF